MGLIAAGIGAAAIAGGTYLNANAAKKRQSFTQYIADQPGVNLNDTYKDSLGAMASNRSLAEQQASSENAFNQAQLDEQLAQEIPGYQALQQQRIRNAQSDLAGQVSPDVSAALQRHAASRGIDSGTVGSQFNRNLEARDFGLTSLDLQQRGANEFQSIIGSTPMAGRVSSGSFLNIDPKTALALRSGERTKRLDILLQKAGLKGATETYGGALNSIGGALLSGGLGGMGGMGGGMGGGGGSGGYVPTTGVQSSQVANEFYGGAGSPYGGG